MKRSTQTFILTIFAACALVLVLHARSGWAQMTGCCIGSVCTDRSAQSCSVAGGTPLSTTCTSENDARCATCSDFSGAAAGLCNAYCNGLGCPAGHEGRACERLLANWRKQTGLPFVPCDAVCCECAAGSMCTTALRCEAAQCRIIDRCEHGECPERKCCECPDGDCTETTARNCRLHGCKSKDDAMCTPNGRCEQCPCGADCVTEQGKGRCVPVPGEDDECKCQVPPPCAFDAAGVCGGDCVTESGVVGTCQQDPAAPNPICTCVPPPPPCDQRATCGGDCAEAGVVGTCQLQNGTPAPVCTCLP